MAPRNSLILATTFAMLVAVSGCLGTIADSSPAPAGTSTHARDLFMETVQPILEGTCKTCHQAGGAGPPFLAPTGERDLYMTVKGWPGLVGSTPESSKIYTKGMHTGPALTMTQAKAVKAWLEAEEDPGP